MENPYGKPTNVSKARNRHQSEAYMVFTKYAITDVMLKQNQLTMMSQGHSTSRSLVVMTRMSRLTRKLQRASTPGVLHGLNCLSSLHGLKKLFQGGFPLALILWICRCNGLFLG
jgi:hypothetical protein